MRYGDLIQFEAIESVIQLLDANRPDEAKKLVDLLGHEHDLTVLTTLLDHEPDLFGDGEGQSFLLAIIIRRQQELRRQALALADQVFADPARDEAGIIETLWLRAAGERR